jgi:hypothetical protein
LLSADLLPEGVLQITGTEGNDTVLMQAFEPEEGTPQLAVALNGETFRYDLEGIGEIRVDLQDGNDRLALNASGVALPNIVVDAGHGDDLVEAAVENNAAARFPLDLRVDLGEGDNIFDGAFLDPAGILDVRAGGGIDIIQGIDVWSGSSVDNHPDFAWIPTYNPGAGADYVDLTFASVGIEFRGPSFKAGVDTGDGDDTTAIEVVGAFDDICMNVYSGAGDDEVSLNLHDGTSNTVFSSIDLGYGDDVARSNVFAVWLTVGFFEVVDDQGHTTVSMDVTDLMPLDEDFKETPLATFQILSAGPSNIDASFVNTLLDIHFAADTGSGDDTHSVKYTMFLADGTPVRSSRIDFDLATGENISSLALHVQGSDGDDTVRGGIIGFGDVSITTDAGAGNDMIVHEVVHTIQVSGGTMPTPQTRQISIIQDMGPGDDISDLVVSTDNGGSGATAPLIERIVINGGDGNDAVAVGVHDGTSNTVFSGEVLSGAGNDTIVAVLDLLPPTAVITSPDESSTAGPQATFEFTVDAGSDDDTVEVRVNDPAGLEGLLDIQAGDGNDTVLLDTIQQRSPDDIITGSGPAGGPHVKVFDGATLAETRSFFSYTPSFMGGVRVAAGDVNGDSIDDVITAAGPGAGPHVKVFDGSTGAEIRSFFAYDPTFTGGVFVAAGDINGDGRDDIITGTDAGAPGGHVKVFDGRTLGVLQSFAAYSTSFSGGVRVATGDVNGDGVPDIITGTGSGSAAHVKVFDGFIVSGLPFPALGSEIRSFIAYDPGFTGGVYVAAGDVNGDGTADIITGAGRGSAGGHVKVFRGSDLSLLNSFFAYEPTFRGGVRVAAGDLNNDGQTDIITGAGPGGGPHVKVFDGQSNALLRSFFAYDPAFKGGVYVAAGDINEHKPALKLALNAGDGDDIAVIDSVARGGPSFEFLVDMGNGADQAIAKAKLEEASLSYATGDAVLNGQLHLIGGAGHDSLLSVFESSGGYDGADRIRLQQDGGGGNDVLNTQWTGPALFGRSPSVAVELDAGSGDDDVTFSVDGGFAALDAQIFAGAGNDRADLRVQNPAAAEGGEDPESTDRARTRVPASVRADMGAGTDKIAVNWNDPLQDANVVLGANLEIVLGGAFSLPEVDDEVLVVFEHGDPRQPIIIGAFWNSHDSTPPDDGKSLSVTMINDGGRLDWSSQLKGGASQDDMQLYFMGKLKVTGNPRTSPRLRAAFDLGAGNDAALIDVSQLVVEGTGDPAPIRVNALGGDGEDVLKFNGNGAPIRLTDDAIIQKGVIRVAYAGFETVSSWEDLKRLSDLYGSDEVLTSWGIGD